MKVILNGAGGRMGREVTKYLLDGFRGSSLAASVDPNSDGCTYKTLSQFNGEADVIVDFSHHSAAEELLNYAKFRNLPVVIATTGQTDEEKEIIKAASTRVPVFFSANMSLGIALLVELAKKTAATFPEADIEIVESHHNRKLDAPSGTALMLAEAIKEIRQDAFCKFGRHGAEKREKNEIGIHSLRMGNVVGEHDVIVATDSQIITLRHEALSRNVFAEGALAAADFIIGKNAGLYTMQDMV